MTEQNQRSYNEIIKSSTIVGGSQVLTIIIAIFRTKILALLLGPAGVGLMGLYSSAMATVSAVTNVGIGNSAVRQIAEVAGSGDIKRIALSIITLRRLAIGLGVVGMLLVVMIREPVSQLTFGNYDHAKSIAMLSIIVFFGTVSLSQTALIQGMRRIGDLARLSLYGSILGTALSIPIIVIWGQTGIVPFLVMISVTAFLASWWYARKITAKKEIFKWKETWSEAGRFFSLGVVFMVSSLMSTSVLYLTRVLVVRQIGIEASGLYQAATTLSTLYISFILNAMGMDFYPRLTAIANDNVECNRLVNEQSEVGLLLAIPGILATLTFAPLVIRFFYSAEFVSAYFVLRWQVLGICLRVISWPLGYILLAKGKGRIFLFTEVLSNIIHVAFIWLGVIAFGFEGTGIAFFLLNIFVLCIVFWTVKNLSGFKWSGANLRLCFIVTPVVAAVFLLQFLFSPVVAMVIGGVFTLGAGICSLKILHKMIGAPKLSDLFQKLMQKFRG
jgi:PST family polysaccharide transporter